MSTPEMLHRRLRKEQALVVEGGFDVTLDLERNSLTVNLGPGIDLEVTFSHQYPFVPPALTFLRGRYMAHYYREHWSPDVRMLRLCKSITAWLARGVHTTIDDPRVNIFPVYPYCHNCGKETDEMCSNCKRTFYCSADCFTAEWAEHRKKCVPPTTI